MPDIPDWTTPFVDVVILLPLLIIFVRLAGLRSFAKMSAHDFVVTVATGSVVAATVLNPQTGWWTGALALAALFAGQVILGVCRARIPGLQRLMDNEPLVLMQDGKMDAMAMRVARVSEDDLRQKLRQAGVATRSKAALVVMETTGDVSVMTDRPDDDVARDVKGF